MLKKISFPIILLFAFSSYVLAKEFHVKKTDKNNIKFISDAPIEDFEGVTSNIDGYLFFENDLTNESQLYFEVDLRTVDTGIGLRNRHMRENYLETDQYPMAAYTGKISKSEKIADNKFKVQVSGEMSIHGVSISQEIEGTIEISDLGLSIIANFIVKLSAHKIDIPSLMFMKIDENMKLQLDFSLEEAK